MKHVIVLYYLAAFSSGLAALSLFFLLWLRFRKALVLKYLVFLAILTLLVVDNAVYYYMNNLISQAGSLSLSVFTLFHFAVFSGLSLLLPLIVFDALEKKLPPAALAFFSVVAGIAVPMMIFPFVAMRPLETSLNWLYVELYGFYFYLFLAVLLFCLVFLLVSLKGVKDLRRRRIILTACVLTLVFLPTFILDGLWTYFQVKNPLIPRGLNFMPLFYLTWNVMSLIYAARFLFTQAGEQIPVVATGPVPAAFIEKYGLTAQEARVMELALQGVTNTQIAEQLFIAMGTVKNHMHKVYEKTGAKNRTSLALLLKKTQG